jgi:homoserine kinase
VRCTIRVPATSANLGAGFDCLGLALDLCNEITVDTTEPPGVSWLGEGADELPTDGSDLIQRTMRHVAGRRSLPSVAVRGTNRIPLARGLGSSSAAVVAGAAAALALLDDDPSPQRVFSHAASIEGHPDNVAPACFGGFTIAMPGGLVRRIDPHPDLPIVLLVPTQVRLATDRARAALSDSVSRTDAVFNIAHAALSVEAFTREPALLGEAMRDRLHQDARLELVPSVRAVFERLRDAGVPVCVSGAGPTLLAVEERADAVPDPGPGWQALRVAVRSDGFELVED